MAISYEGVESTHLLGRHNGEGRLVRNGGSRRLVLLALDRAPESLDSAHRGQSFYSTRALSASVKRCVCKAIPGECASDG